MKRFKAQSAGNFKAQIKREFDTLGQTPAAMALWEDLAWREFLVERGWSCPSWPLDVGGPGWNDVQKLIWYRLCSERFDGFCEPPEIREVGPCLIRWGGEVEKILVAIAHLEERWAMAVFDKQDTVTTFDLDTGRLSGCKMAVRFYDRADRLLIVALEDNDGYVLLALDPTAEGVVAEATTSLSGDRDYVTLTFIDVAVEKTDVIARITPEKIHTLYDQMVALELGHTGVLNRQLDQIRESLCGVDDPGSLHRRADELEIELEALSSLESRMAAALARGEPPPVPGMLLQARILSLKARLGDLLVEAFGYYGLPFPDAMMLHNEGSVGPPNAAQATRAMLVISEQVNYANLAGDLYDRAVGALSDAFVKQNNDHKK